MLTVTTAEEAFTRLFAGVAGGDERTKAGVP